MAISFMRGESLKAHHEARLILGQAHNIGGKRVDLFRAQDDVGHGGMRRAEKNLDREFVRRGHSADVY